MLYVQYYAAIADSYIIIAKYSTVWNSKDYPKIACIDIGRSHCVMQSCLFLVTKWMLFESYFSCTIIVACWVRSSCLVWWEMLYHSICECGGRPLLMRIRLILKDTHEIRISQGRNVLARKLMSISWLLCVSSNFLFPLSSHSSSLRPLRLWSRNYYFTKWRFNAEHTFIMHDSLP